MSAGALIFMLSAWAVVIGLVAWSYSRLMKAPPEQHENLPPPGSIP